MMPPFMAHTRPTACGSDPHRSLYGIPAPPSVATWVSTEGGLPVDRHAFSAVCVLSIEFVASKSPQPAGLVWPPVNEYCTSSTCAAPRPRELYAPEVTSETNEFVFTRNTR